MDKKEYELYTRVRLRDLSVATVVDRIGPDYIVDVGNDASDWDTIEISADEVRVLLVLRNNRNAKVEGALRVDIASDASFVSDDLFKPVV